MTGDEVQRGTGYLPSRIEPYRIIRQLGEGSSSHVYLAAQSEPSREVALKLLRGVGASQQDHQRFRREAELLALLEHPGIARLYAAGVLEGETGPQPYLAMEYVRGGDLLTHAREQRLDWRGKLALLAVVCRAVHYAHSRGIVHRDLKPANILVDNHGQPKILDFGVAHIAEPGAGMTQLGQVLGTVPYMSAEQLAGGAARSDPRSDVYSLGVIAYELLSDHLPHPGLSQSTVIEAIAIIRRGRVQRLSQHLPAARGDIETVVMKAMATESAQRYGSAAELAADLERVIDQRPIEARPPSLAYASGLFLRRHRALSAAVALAVIALVGGSVVSLRFGLSESRARAEAEARASQLDASNTFFENILGATDPEAARARPPSLRDFLDAARRSLEADTALPAPVRALVARTMGLTYARSGDVEPGLALIDRAQAALDAAADTDRYTRERLILARAAVLNIAGRYDEALQSLQPLLQRETPGSLLEQRLWIEAREEASTAIVTLGRTQEAAALLPAIRADAERLFGPDDQLSLAAALQQANLLHQLGDAAAAEAAYAALIPRLNTQLGAFHAYTLQSRLAQAAIARERGDLVASERLTRSLVSDLDRELGPRHMLTITAHFMLAAVLQSQNPKSAEAVEQLRGVLAQYREQLGQTHHYTLSAMSALAVFLQAQGQLAEAAELSLQSLQAVESQGFADGPEVLPKYNAYALILMQLGRLDEARSRFQSLLERARKALGDQHLQTITYAANYGECLLRSGQPQAALAILEPDYHTAREQLGATHPQTGVIAERLAAAYRATGRVRDAERLPRT